LSKRLGGFEVNQKHDTIYRLLTADDNYLLQGYASFQFDIKDLIDITGYRRQDIYYVIYNHFGTYVDLRNENKKKMFKQIEHYINIAIPIEVIQESMVLLKDISQIDTLRRSISRLISRHHIMPEIPPITLGRFRILYTRLRLRDIILNNAQTPKPLTLKQLAEQYEVSFSLISKINQRIDEIPPYMISDDYASVYLKISYMYDIYLALQEGMSIKQVARKNYLDDSDVLLIQKTFKLIHSDNLTPRWS